MSYPFLKKKNNARSTLSSNLTAVATTCLVTSLVTFPDTPDFLATIWNKSLYSNPGDDPNMEIVKVTGITSGNTFTITRAQESTPARVHASGSAIELLLTKGQIEEIQYYNFFKVVRAASTANVNISSAPATLDGVTLVRGDRVLLKNQSTQSQNGIYIYYGVGQAMSRAVDYDTADKILGSFVYIIAGSTNNFNTYTCSNTSTITLGSTSIGYRRLYNASTGLTLSAGNVYSITNTGVTAGGYASASNTPCNNVNAQGQITYIDTTSVPISISQSQIYDLDVGLTRAKAQAMIHGMYA
jgi:hypothetical protein